jgi:hypothetical protein
VANDTQEKAPVEKYTLIPGTDWGIAHYSVGQHHGIILSHRIKVKRKDKKTYKPTGEIGEEWDRPSYYADFAQVARAIAEYCGGTDMKALLQEIVAERKRLAKVLQGIMETSPVTKRA